MNKNKYKIYFYFLQKFRKKVLIFLFFSIGLSITQAVLLATLYPFVSFSLNQNDNNADAGFFLNNIKIFISKIPIDNPLISVSLFLIVIAVLLGVFRYCSFSSLLNLSYGINYKLQSEIYEKTLNSDLSYFINNKQGDILFQTKEPPRQVGYIIKDSAILTRESLMTIFLLLMMFSINIKLSLLVLLVGGVFSVAIKYMSKKIVYKSGKAMTKALGEEDIILSESLNGIYTIKAFLVEKMWSKIFENKIMEYIYHAKRTNVMKEIPLLVIESLVIVIIALTAIVFTKLYSGSFNEFLPIFSIYALSILRIIPSFSKVSNSAMNIVSLFSNMEISYEMLHKTSSTINSGSKSFHKLEKCIDYKNISFGYPGNGNLVFEDISFSINRNEIVAIVGKSGSGKTTLINLLLRFYDPIQGRIEIDGVDLKDLDRTSWLERIGFVSQEPFIFHATVADNIGFGKDYCIEEIMEAAKLSGAHCFIEGLKDQYQTIVGEKGMKLSGGEKQRIAIARAIIKKPQILIFDEATSALDTETEKLIQETIQLISKSYTVIIIAHRLSTVKIAHRILVFDRRKLVEEGSHEELLKAGNHYSRLYTVNV